MQRHHPYMLKLLDIFFELFAEVVRALVADEFSERARAHIHRLRHRPRGLLEIRRELHRKCQKRLFDRLSTEGASNHAKARRFTYFTK
jgi:hypothetical protein